MPAIFSGLDFPSARRGNHDSAVLSAPWLGRRGWPPQRFVSLVINHNTGPSGGGGAPAAAARCLPAIACGAITERPRGLCPPKKVSQVLFLHLGEGQADVPQKNGAKSSDSNGETVSK